MEHFSPMERSVNGNDTRAVVKLAVARQRKGMILCMMFDWSTNLGAGLGLGGGSW